MDTFSIDINDVVHQIGSRRLRELIRLIEHLRGWKPKLDSGLTQLATGPSSDSDEDQLSPSEKRKFLECSFRYAPSIVTRSEAGLLGISDPRFAIRVSLPDDLGIMNLRRVSILEDRLRDLRFSDWKLPPALAQTWEVDTTTRPTDVIASNSPVADSLLCPPPAMRAYYHGVDRDHGACFGERSPMRGILFVRHIQMQGGGLCAQACCFMVAGMLNRFIEPSEVSPDPSVHGIAEITALISGEEKSYLHLTGLEHRKIGEYLERIGLSAPQQFSMQHVEPKRQLFTTAVRSYAASGIPVIVAITQALRPWGPESELSPRLPAGALPPDRTLNHAVVVVGAGKRGTVASKNLIINDPAEFPFIQVNEDRFADAALTSLSHDLPDGRRLVLGDHTFFAATPGLVKIALQSTRRSRPSRSGRNRVGDGVCPGLFEIALFLQKDELPAVHRVLPLPPELYQGYRRVLGEFQLIRVGDAADFGLESLHILPPAALAEVRNQLQKFAPDRWVWVQHRKREKRQNVGSVWIWDAQADSNCLIDDKLALFDHHFFEKCLARSAEEFAQFVIAVFSYEGTSCKCVFHSRRRPKEIVPLLEVREKQLPAPSLRELKVSLISSFTLAGIDASFRNWPSDVGIDLYCFMNQDKLLTREKGMFGAAYLAKLAVDRALLEKTASNIRKSRDQYCKGKEPIVALTSFVPQLGAPRTETSGQLGSQAIIGLLRLAKKLKKAGEPLRTVEIVAGGCITGISRLIPRQPENSSLRPQFYALRSPRDQAIREYCRSLSEVCQSAELNEGDDIALSIEQEPGPLYRLDGLHSLELMYKGLKEFGLLGRVGFNLDISHWCLANILPSTLQGKPHLLNQITHVHVSSHAKGHFGDLPIDGVLQEESGQSSGVSGIDSLREWLNLIAETWHRPPDNRPASLARSGYVSIELEACRGMDVIRQSVRTLKGLLSE